MIQTLLFDFGGVLVDLDRSRCIEAFRALGFDVEPYLGAYRQGGAFARLESGEISVAEFCESLRRESGINRPDAGFIAAWEAYLTELPAERLDMLLRLKKKYRLALLSNTNAVHWRMAEERFFRYKGLRVTDFFEAIFLSHELHVQKPDAAIFELAVRGLECKPDEVLFLDDSAVNCAAARRAGLQAEVARADGQWLPLAEELLRMKDPGCGTVATIGFFDGVHRGHRYLLEQARDEARRRGMRSVAITFRQHPRKTLKSDWQPELLTTPAEKREFIEGIGLDECIFLDFTEDMARLKASQFMQMYLRDRLNTRLLVMGYDHHFGADDLTDPADYRRAGMVLGIEVIQADKAPLDLPSVSSSEVRRCLQAGDVEGAAERLGRPYQLGGVVVEGHHVGRELGYPTANLQPDAEKLVPRTGVYATRATLDGRTYAAMTNIGRRPTLGNGTETTIETHLIDFDGNAYGQCLTLQFARRLRDEKKHDSIEDLRRSLQHDEACVRTFFSTLSSHETLA